MSQDSWFGKMREHSFREVLINDQFWSFWLDLVRTKALPHQLRMLEETKCVDNFRIAAGRITGFRRQYFHSDSDLYKWVEAASLVLQLHPDDELQDKVDYLMSIFASARDIDHYIFTYNTLHFPGRRWKNLQIHHELYCMGHLIEAAMAHSDATGSRNTLSFAEAIADQLVQDFLGEERITGYPGHEGVELALIKLYRKTGKQEYFKLAREFIERRGVTVKHVGWDLLRSAIDDLKCSRKISKQRKSFEKIHGKLPPPPELGSPFGLSKNLKTIYRSLKAFLSGSYSQQRVPIRELKTVEGHAVRMMYLASAMTDVYLVTGDTSYLTVLEGIWEQMTKNRMYVTGGLGSVELIEGFGPDNDLPNRTCYCETCAAIGSIFMNFRLLLATGLSQYADLIERLLYNAMLVGMARDGQHYFYRNLLETRHPYERQEWYSVPCCPSNIARMIATIGGYIYSLGNDDIWIHQFIGNEAVFKLKDGNDLKLLFKSDLPWKGQASLQISILTPQTLTIHLRIPEWITRAAFKVNQEVDFEGCNIYGYHSIAREWKDGDVLNCSFEISPRFIHGNPEVKANRGRVALARGPLIYCLESIDHPDADIHKARIDVNTPLSVTEEPILGGIKVIRGEFLGGNPLMAIPYHLWANRGKSSMITWIKSSKS